MQAAVIVFPGSNCDRDAAVALEKATGRPTLRVWHADTEMPAVDLIVLPGGFSYGDYLRTGAMAAHAPLMREVVARAAKGVRVMGICNGFQILCESGLLPGILLRNASLRFICREVTLRVENAANDFLSGCATGQKLRIPIAHGDGNYFADKATLDRLEDTGRVALRYDGANPNGSARDIAGILNERGNVLGLMPHPERAAEPLHGSTDGSLILNALAKVLS